MKTEIRAARAALRNRGQAGQAGGFVLLFVVLVAALLALKGWALMIAWGIAASILGVATIGFWPAVAVAALLSIALGTSAGGTSS